MYGGDFCVYHANLDAHPAAALSHQARGAQFFPGLGLLPEHAGILPEVVVSLPRMPGLG